VSEAWPRLRAAAWLAVAAHTAAGLVMLLVLARGLETAPSLEARLRFVAEHAAAWTAGWLVWNAAALSILYYCVRFAAAHAERPATAFAVALCAAAVACDLAAQSVFMGVLPALAGPALLEVRGGAGRDAALFLLWHRSAVVLTGYVANGLYTGATLVLCWTTRRAYPPATVAAGLLTCVAGVALSAAALVESVAGMYWANVALLPSLLVWLAGVALQAGANSRAGAVLNKDA
jgi:hypothetical protein